MDKEASSCIIFLSFSAQRVAKFEECILRVFIEQDFRAELSLYLQVWDQKS